MAPLSCLGQREEKLMSRSFFTPCLVLLLALCSVISGCSGNNKVTKANYDKIKPGMTLADVEAVLGKGDSEEGLDLSEGSGAAGALGITGMSAGSSRKSSIQWMKWGDDNKFIRIGFQGDKVAKGKIEQRGL
jgi:hypothetical protein